MPKLTIRYAQGQSDDLAPLKSVGIDDDSATGWWGGAQKCFASVALAAVLATTTLSTALAEKIQQGDQGDVPAGSLVNLKVDEDYWQNQTRPVSASLYLSLPYFFDPADTVPAPAAFQPDEDFWPSPVLSANPVLPILSAFFRSTVPPDQDEIPAGSLFGQSDEDFWRNAVAPVQAKNSWPQQWAFDVQESAGSLFGQYDEDFWRNPVASVPANLYHSPLLGDQEEIPAGSLLSGQPDEDLWRNPTPPLPATIYQRLPYLFESADFVPPVAPQIDEDIWRNPSPPVASSLYQRLPLGDVEEVPAGSLYGQPGEDFWPNPALPLAPSLYQRLPYLFDLVEIGSAQSGTALPAGLSLVAAENDPTATGQVPAPGGSRPARRQRGGFSSGPPPIIFGIARPAGLSLRADQGKVSASGSARATVAVPALRIGAGQPTAKGIKNPTAEELMAILMGL